MIKGKKPLILISNDDGFTSKGIQALIEVVRPLGEVVVVAPDGPRSGMSSALTPNIPLRVNLVKESEDLTIYSCNGTPVDCVKLSLSELLDRKPDLLVSGINHGSNSSICVIYSGTMGATMEGCIVGIPSIGFSLTDHSPNADFTTAALYARIVSEMVMKEGLPGGICLNVNIPNIPFVKGMKICTQSKGRWIKEFYHSKDQLGRKIFWLTGEYENDEPDNINTDEWALTNGFVSVVPCQLDLTAYKMIDRMKSWELVAEPLSVKN